MTVTAATSAPTSDIDLFSDEVLADSYPVYEQLREQAPVVHLPAGDVWAITRYAEVREAFGDPEAFTSTRVAFNQTMNDNLVGTSLATDPPQHQHLRTVLTENLTPRALRRMGAQIAATADTLIQDLAQRESFDGMSDLATPFVTGVVMDLIGVQGEVREKLLPWGEAAFNLLGPMNARSQASFASAGELFEWTHQTLSADDLAEGSIGRAIFAAGERGDIAPETCGMIVHQYIAAGMDTTISAIGNAVLLLGRHPEQFRMLREDPTLVPSAFAEVQRYLTPTPVFGRGAARDVEIQGITIPAGAQVALLLAAGNRDPRHFEDPESFDITRNPTDHLSFGYGIHTCAGQGLARLEAHAVIDALARHLSSFEIGETRTRLNNITRPFDRLEVRSIVPA